MFSGILGPVSDQTDVATPVRGGLKDGLSGFSLFSRSSPTRCSGPHIARADKDNVRHLTNNLIDVG